MLKRVCLFSVMCLAALAITKEPAQAGQPGQPSDWQRFYYYPYVYYPHNFQRIPQSYDHLYYRYPLERRIPVYNSGWHNFYLMDRPYHSGHHFILDTI